jgi:hypothetical protein
MQGSQFETELSASQFESLDSRAEKVRALMEKASAQSW